MFALRHKGRRVKRRGVSPIIATILLVAITVVIAAVLYVLVTSYLRGTGSAPLDIELQNLAIGHNAKSNQNWLNFTSVSSSKGLTTDVFGFKIVAANGALVSPWDVKITFNGVTQSQFQSGNASWSNIIPVNSSETFSFNTGSANLVGSTDDILAFGLSSTPVTGGYQGL